MYRSKGFDRGKVKREMSSSERCEAWDRRMLARFNKNPQLKELMPDLWKELNKDKKDRWSVESITKNKPKLNSPLFLPNQLNLDFRWKPKDGNMELKPRDTDREWRTERKKQRIQERALQRKEDKDLMNQLVIENTSQMEDKKMQSKTEFAKIKGETPATNQGGSPFVIHNGKKVLYHGKKVDFDSLGYWTKTHRDEDWDVWTASKNMNGHPKRGAKLKYPTIKMRYSQRVRKTKKNKENLEKKTTFDLGEEITKILNWKTGHPIDFAYQPFPASVTKLRKDELIGRIFEVTELKEEDVRYHLSKDNNMSINVVKGLGNPYLSSGGKSETITLRVKNIVIEEGKKQVRFRLPINKISFS